MSNHCYYCGLGVQDFIKKGQFGCGYCPDYLTAIPSIEYVLKQKKPWSRSGITPRDMGILPEKTLYMEGKEFHYLARYRIARNIRKTFFSPFRFPKEEVLDFLQSYFPRVKKVGEKVGIGSAGEKNPIEIWSAWKNQTFPKIHFLVGDEDQIRWEILWRGKLQKNTGIEMPPFPRKKELMNFLGNRQLFSFHKSWGYVNACPTNSGRGDRFSILVQKDGEPEAKENESEDWFIEKAGIRLAILDRDTPEEKRYISVKNFNKRRKMYFLRNLLPLIFKDSGFNVIPLASSNK